MALAPNAAAAAVEGPTVVAVPTLSNGGGPCDGPFGGGPALGRQGPKLEFLAGCATPVVAGPLGWLWVLPPGIWGVRLGVRRPVASRARAGVVVQVPPRKDVSFLVESKTMHECSLIIHASTCMIDADRGAKSL